MDSTDNVTSRPVHGNRPVITATGCNGKPSHTSLQFQTELTLPSVYKS
jgi:hypothetical protein